jgi:hypothetical protein
MVTLAEPLPHTLLNLPRFAKIMGINPVHFMGAIGPAGAFPMLDNRCNDVWPQYSWQYSDSISRYELAETIQQVEYDLAQELGWFPAPMWINEEVRDFPRFYRKDSYRAYGRNVRGMRVSARTRFIRVIAPGRRGTTLIKTATVAAGTLTYSDEDLDGFFETATIEVATTLTEPREIEVFIQGIGAHPGWRIWPSRSRMISDGTFTAVFDSWLFIDPDILDRYPDSDGFGAIDISTVSEYVTSVDVYRVFNDTTQVSAQFFWEPTTNVLPFSTGDSAGELVVQDGVLHIRSPQKGTVVPTPATYADGEWTAVGYTKTRDPDLVKLWYYAGEYSNDYFSENTGDPLPQKWARTIAQLAVARMERPFCSCGNLTALAAKWRVDAAIMGNDLNIAPNDLENPFGTRYGEILAWRTVRNTRGRSLGGGAI